MEHSFWHNKWKINQVGFHLDYVHPLLKRNLELFQVNNRLRKHETVFVPLCGKTLDIGYFLTQGYQVVANELSEIAVQEVFNQLGLKPDVSDWSAGKLYKSDKLSIFVGDFFALSKQDLNSQGKGISLVYDRAALIALPEKMRLEYAQHLAKITQHTAQLLITLDYDQTIAGGPPFAVPTAEVEALYGGAYPIQLLEEADIIEEEPRFKAKGLTSFYQRAYKLK
jgi:thiopurine S-methyltransferase